MKAFENLTLKNSLLFAMKCYDNPQCLDEEEFIEDYKRLKYVKRLCRRYLATGRISERLMLNHLVLLNNVFTAPASARLLFLKCSDPRMYRVLKAFMSYMGTLPDVVTGIDGEDIYTEGIPNDEKLTTKLQAL
jgi:hypothetical protein